MALQKRIEHLEANGAFAAPTHSPEFEAYMGYLARRSRASREFVSAFGREPEADDVLRKDDLTSDGKDGIGELQGVPEIPRDRAFRWATIAAETLGTGAGNFHRLCTEPPFTAVVFLGAIGPESMCGNFKFGPKHVCRPATENDINRT